MHLLIVEDSAVQRKILEDLVCAWGYDLTSVEDGSKAAEVLQGPDPPRLVILDWMLPGMDGVEVCQTVRRMGREPYIYILLLTSRSETEDRVTGLDAGADDYMPKPFEAEELKARLRAGERILQLQEKLVESREALRVQATRDGLTGAWNRGAIVESLERELSRARRTDKPASVIMGDVDNFKRINDMHGHAAGDAVLREVVRRMGGGLRAYDMVGRYGGEEFMVVLPDCDIAGAVVVAERLRLNVSRGPVLSGEASIPVTLSQGIATAVDTTTTVADVLLQAADTALYEAKRNGRNRVEVAAVALCATENRYGADQPQPSDRAGEMR